MSSYQFPNYFYSRTGRRNLNPPPGQIYMLQIVESIERYYPIENVANYDNVRNGDGRYLPKYWKQDNEGRLYCTYQQALQIRDCVLWYKEETERRAKEAATRRQEDRRRRAALEEKKEYEKSYEYFEDTVTRFIAKSEKSRYQISKYPPSYKEIGDKNLAKIDDKAREFLQKASLFGDEAEPVIEDLHEFLGIENEPEPEPEPEPEEDFSISEEVSEEPIPVVDSVTIYSWETRGKGKFTIGFVRTDKIFRDGGRPSVVLVKRGPKYHIKMWGRDLDIVNVNGVLVDVDPVRGYFENEITKEQYENILA